MEKEGYLSIYMLSKFVTDLLYASVYLLRLRY